MSLVGTFSGCIGYSVLVMSDTVGKRFVSFDGHSVVS